MLSDSSLENIQHISTISPEQYRSVVTLCHVPSGCVVQWICWGVINCSHLRCHPDNSCVSKCNAAGCVFRGVRSVLVHSKFLLQFRGFLGEMFGHPLLLTKRYEHIRYNFWLKSFLRFYWPLTWADQFSKPLFVQGSCTHRIQVFEFGNPRDSTAVKETSVCSSSLLLWEPGEER